MTQAGASMLSYHMEPLLSHFMEAPCTKLPTSGFRPFFRGHEG